MRHIILASTSPYRKALLKQLGIEFDTQKPLVNEDDYKDPKLSPYELAQRLAYIKTQSVAKQNPNTIVIGGDQLAHFKGQTLGKPKTKEKALEQLKMMSGLTHELVTSICVIYQDQEEHFTDITKLTMKSLSDEQIKKYIERDQPLDCAASYKIEMTGMSLFEKIESQDFSSIQGIPLLRLSQILSRLGVAIP